MSEQDNLRSVLELQKEIAKLKAEDAEANKERIAGLEKEVKLRHAECRSNRSFD